MIRKSVFAALVTAVLLGGVPALAADQDAQTISIVPADTLQWKDYPGLPGVKFVVIAGNPSQPGLYVIRAKFAPHTMSRPHWHPEARYVTVLQGTWWAGVGENFDPNSTTPVPTGGFAIHAPGKVHYDGAKDEEAIVQISGIGPSGTNVVNPGDSKQ
jgi:quercetin dioxygenase-like cupin family protein